jgi:hypothetical protein
MSLEILSSAFGVHLSCMFPWCARFAWLLGLSSFAAKLQQRNIMIFPDNTSAEAATRKGAVVLRQVRAVRLRACYVAQDLLGSSTKDA